MYGVLATFGIVQPNTNWRHWSIEKRAKRLISDPALIDAKLQTLQHRRRVAQLSVLYRIYFKECAKALHELTPPSSTVRHRDTWCGLHRYVVDMPPCRMNQFGSSFLKEWNALTAILFPDQYYNLDVFNLIVTIRKKKPFTL